MIDPRRIAAPRPQALHGAGAVPRRGDVAVEPSVVLPAGDAAWLPGPITRMLDSPTGRAVLMGLVGGLTGLAIGSAVFQFGPAVDGAPPAPVSPRDPLAMPAGGMTPHAHTAAPPGRTEVVGAVEARAFVASTS